MSVLEQVRTTAAEHNLLSPGDTIVVGVSGGPDSLVLLHVLTALREELRITLHVAHLNHRLRGTAADTDAEFVGQVAQSWGLPATVEARNVAAMAQTQHLSLEEAARQVRYAFLAEVAQRTGARKIAVAHNADDQVETILMHFLRGAGLSGLRGMEYKVQSPKSKAKSDKGLDGRILPFSFELLAFDLSLVRPLLDVSRAEIEAYALEHNLAPRVDASNADTTFFRNRLRHEVLPYLEKQNPNLRRVLAHTAQGLADDYAFLQAHVRSAYDQVAREQDDLITFARPAWSALPPSLQRGTLRLAVQHLRTHLRDIDWMHVEDARRVALQATTGARATLPGGLELVIAYDIFTIGSHGLRLALPDIPLLNVAHLELNFPGVTRLPNSDWNVVLSIQDHPGETQGAWTAQFDLAKCTIPLSLRTRRAGDRFQPAGLSGHTKSLHEYMIDAKIARALRDRLPLLVAEDQILWVCGYRLGESARVTRATRRVLVFKFEKRNEGEDGR